MKRTTLSQIKINLPTVLKRIEDCKEFISIEQSMLDYMEYRCVRKCIDNTEGSYWTSYDSIKETLANLIEHEVELEYLQGMVSKLKQCDGML